MSFIQDQKAWKVVNERNTGATVQLRAFNLHSLTHEYTGNPLMPTVIFFF